MTTSHPTTHPPNDAAEHAAIGSNPMKARGSAIHALKGLLKNTTELVRTAADFSLLLAILLLPAAAVIAMIGIVARLCK